MAYQPYPRKINTTPIPKFDDYQTVKSSAIGNGKFTGMIAKKKFMHDEWWYVITSEDPRHIISWYAESTLVS
jgi:hypothetical protein